MKSDAMRKDLTTRSNDIIKRYKADLDILKATKQKLQDELEQLQKASSTLETEKIDWLNTNKNLENENAKLRTELESTPVSSSSGLVVSSGPNLAVSISEPASAVTTEVTVAAVTESSVPSSSSSLVQNQDPPIPSSPSPSTKRSREEDPAAPKITPITFDDNSDDAAVSSSVAATELSEPNTKRVRMDSSAVENEIHSSNPPNNASSTVVSTPLLMAVPVKIQRSLTPVPPTVMSSAVPAPLSSAPTSAATPKIVSSVETPVAPTRSSLNDLLAKKMAALKPQLQSPQLNPEPTAHGTTTITSTSTPGSLPATTAPIVSASSVSSSPAAGAAPSLFGIPSIFVPPKPPATAQQARVRPARTESLTETGTPGPTPGRPRPRPYATAAQVRVINQPNQQLQYQNSPGRNAAGRPAVRLQRLPRSAGGGTPTQPSPTSAQTQRVVAGGVRPHPRPAQGQ
ncbi:hypothetical protein BC830DRAFT_581226 [Chytriomyces sp. MP71]|nr:hypothetical protein BC830DRAFT_581226 [Chytriomyces sp. MP71]